MSALGYGWRYFRRHGLIPTVRAIIKRYVYRSYQAVITHNGLAGPPADDHVGNVTFRLATPSDLDHLAELERYGRGSTLRASVTEDNDWLFVACDGDRIVATRWVSRAVPPHGLMSRVVQLRQGQVWALDIFCLPEYRNKGIGRHLSLFSDRLLASRGYTAVLGAVTVFNTPSFHMHLHVGRHPFCYVSYFRFLFYERLLISKEIPEQFGAGRK